MPADSEFKHDDHVQIRTFTSADQESVSRLYTEGLLVGQIPDNDTGADIEMVEEAYLESRRSHFWVAVVEGDVVGMIGVADDEHDVAEIRRLRVEPTYQDEDIANRLLEMALSFCRHHGYLKVRLDTRVDADNGAMALFDRFAFQHTRSRDVPGKEVLEFYQDLYREPAKGDNGSN